MEGNGRGKGWAMVPVIIGRAQSGWTSRSDCRRCLLERSLGDCGAKWAGYSQNAHVFTVNVHKNVKSISNPTVIGGAFHHLGRR